MRVIVRDEIWPRAGAEILDAAYIIPDSDPGGIPVTLTFA
jgi:hypothetical protein